MKQQDRPKNRGHRLYCRDQLMTWSIPAMTFLARSQALSSFYSPIESTFFHT